MEFMRKQGGGLQVKGIMRKLMEEAMHYVGALRNR